MTDKPKPGRPPATPAQRKATERARKAAAGLVEVRGIYAQPEKHAAIKQAAAAIIGFRIKADNRA